MLIPVHRIPGHSCKAIGRANAIVVAHAIVDAVARKDHRRRKNVPDSPFCNRRGGRNRIRPIACQSAGEGVADVTHDAFLEEVISQGIAGAKADYKPSDKLKGSIAGFEACRGKNIPELTELLSAARIATWDARQREASDYWWFRCYECEVEWVCNCVSACLLNQGLPTIVPPTARGVMQAARIVGVHSP